MMQTLTKTEASFKARFQAEPLIVTAPGRINLIGEHTDYNQGWVLPAAIDKKIYLAITKRSDQIIHLYAEDYQQSHETRLDQLVPSGKLWPDYILGVVQQLQKKGAPLEGFNIVFGGDIPLGAGLSSSAALECATATALNHVFSLNYSPLELALLSQAAENEFVGVKCGLMDQYASIFGKKDHLIKLDCAQRAHEYIPFTAPDVRIILFDTQVKHSLASSAYNQRREECEQGVALIKAHHPEVNSLRDVNAAMLREYVQPQDKTVYQRCSYVVAEMERLEKACAFLEAGQLREFGACMFETHEGLREQYEVSCRELDILVEAVKDRPEVLGARMMGGGFGGCTVNLVEADAAEALADTVSAAYQKATGQSLSSYFVSIEEGAGIGQRAQ